MTTVPAIRFRGAGGTEVIEVGEIDEIGRAHV